MMKVWQSLSSLLPVWESGPGDYLTIVSMGVAKVMNS